MKAFTVDVAVIGAGPAGIAAAVTCSGRGLKTVLIDDNKTVGGTVLKGNISTLCGLYPAHAGTKGNTVRHAAVYSGFPTEFANQLMQTDGVKYPLKMGNLLVLPFRPQSFLSVAQRLLAAEKTLDVLLNSRLTDVTVNTSQIESVCVITENHINRTLSTNAVIDCTGNANVCRLSGAPLMAGNAREQAPAMIVPLAQTGGAFDTRLKRIQAMMIIQRAARAGQLPEICANMSFIPVLDPDRISIRITLNEKLIHERVENEDHVSGKMDQTVRLLAAFIRANIPDAARCAVPDCTFHIVDRSGARGEGKYILTGNDVIGGLRVPDRATVGIWPIEKWNARGEPSLEPLSLKRPYDIPIRALQSKTISNLYFAGKSISADDNAIASARVIACCFATGEAAGRLAVENR